jgi:hypothetical protein
MSDDAGYIPDSKVAKLLNKHVKTIKRWDGYPHLKQLGWPDRVDLNGRGHRNQSQLQEFLRNAAAAHLSKA